jgi:aminoglycoside phosphotransferase (APT) family kinase protein
MAAAMFTHENFLGYLRHRFGEEALLDELRRFPRGSSRETWFLTFRTNSATTPVSAVLRTDLPGGSMDPSSLEQEYFMYERLGHTIVPIAHVLWWEGDRRWIGRPFFVREKIDGDWNIAHFSDPDPQYDDLRISIAREHLRTLSLVHAVDWRGLGLDRRLTAPADEADAAHAYIKAIRAQYDRIAVEAIPIIAEICEWLHDHAPTAPRLCLCKGTNGYGEEVFRGNRIVALSDWEEASIGDPAADFAFMQGFLEPIRRDGETLWDLPHALDFYRDISGIPVAVTSVGYYQVVRCLRLLILAHNAGARMRDPLQTFIRQAWTGTEVLHISKHVLAAAAGLLPELTPQRFAELNATVDMT